MTEPTNELMLQFLEWVASRPRTYAEAMDVWRTSCPRLTVWEDALMSGLIEVAGTPPGATEVTVTALGRTMLRRGSVS